MRCFIAIELPEECKTELKQAQSKLKGAKLRPVKDFHLTLKFLGEIQPDKVGRTKNILKNVNFNKINCELDRIGVFPNNQKPRVVWVGIKPEQEIIGLQQKIDAALKEEFKKEKDFKAHATLARIKFIDNKKEFLDNIKNIKVEKIKFIINDFRLKKSALTPQGPVYEDVEVYEPKVL